MEDEKKARLFESTPIPRAVLTLSVPTVLSSLVMVLYNLADTYFVGMLQNPIQNSAVTLAAPVLLAFNAVNNLFGVGSSSMMSRALGAKDYDTVRRSSAFGFYCALLCGALFSALTAALRVPLLALLGADASTAQATMDYLRWTVFCGAVPAILNVVMAYLVRSEGATLHASIGSMSGWALNIVLDPIFILPWGLDMGAAGAGLATCISNCAACAYFFVQLLCLPVLLRTALCPAGQDLCVPPARHGPAPAGAGAGGVRGGRARLHPEPAQRHRHDGAQQLHRRLRPGRHRRHGHRLQNQHDPHVHRHGRVPGPDAAGKL